MVMGDDAKSDQSFRIGTTYGFCVVNRFKAKIVIYAVSSEHSSSFEAEQNHST